MNNENTNWRTKLRKGFLAVAGWLIPLVVSGPSLFIWAGLMTMPLLIYVGIMFLSLFDPSIRYSGQAPTIPYFLSALDVMLLGGPHLPDKIMSISGIFLMVYATIHLNRNRKSGLVISGPYRLVRNPQYFGALLYTINLTSRSYREVLGDVGWLGPTGTLLVWLGTVLAYILLALIEEGYLTKEFPEAYPPYHRRTPFLIPFTGAHRTWIEIAIALVIPAALLWGLVRLNFLLYI